MTDVTYCIDEPEGAKAFLGNWLKAGDMGDKKTTGLVRVAVNTLLVAMDEGHLNPRLTPQQYHLVMLAEECAEVAQRAAKAMRFGLEEVQPGQALTNRERLQHEVSDLQAMCDLLELRTSGPDVEERIEKKVAKAAKYLEYSRSLGIVS